VRGKEGGEKEREGARGGIERREIGEGAKGGREEYR